MQNFDLYDRRPQARNFMPGSVDPEFFTHDRHDHESAPEISRNKASHLFFIITLLCIISFTTGLVLGIRYGGGKDRELVDKDTLSAVSNLKNRVAGTAPVETAPGKKTGDTYPKESYPYVILLGEKIPEKSSASISGYFSTRGHRVIRLNQQEGVSLFVGPYKDEESAKLSLKKILTYNDIASGVNPQIIKRI